jgi:hypothetical protein
MAKAVDGLEAIRYHCHFAETSNQTPNLLNLKCFYPQ